MTASLDVAPRTDAPAVFSCPQGHTWCSTPRDKWGCPYCSKRRAKLGFGLDATHPEIAKRWSARNGYPASLVSAGASRYAWFNCLDHPHDFVGAVASIVSRGATCGVCAGKRVLSGFNDLRTLHPEVAGFWHPNNPCGPDEVAAFSHAIALWRCPDCKFDWRQSVAKRVRRGPKCTACEGRTLAPGINDFASQHPELVPEWDASNDRGPSEVLQKSGYMATWRCRVHTDFTWSTQVRNRANGTGCPICGGQRVIAGINDLPTTHPQVVAEWDAHRNEVSPHEVSATSGVVAWWNCAEHGPYSKRVESRARGFGCGECARGGSSSGERELRDFVSGLVGKEACIQRYRRIPGAGEVDLFLPELNIAIEYNGVYWHSERGGKGRGRTFHQEKYLRCREAGVQLIQIWEDNWRTNRDAVEAMLRTKLGVSPQVRIGARSCTVYEPARAQVRDLLTRNHLQGHRDGTLYLGLRDPAGKLAAAMVVTRTKLTWTIDRYASEIPVQGGFGKLLAHLEKLVAQSNGGRIVTFSDNDVSDGALYAKTGFVAEKQLPPDYAYVIQTDRVHKFNYRKDRFRRDPRLKYREGFSEAQLADLNGLHRAWDSGKVRWVREVAGAGADPRAAALVTSEVAPHSQAKRRPAEEARPCQ